MQIYHNLLGLQSSKKHTTNKLIGEGEMNLNFENCEKVKMKFENRKAESHEKSTKDKKELLDLFLEISYSLANKA